MNPAETAKYKFGRQNIIVHSVITVACLTLYCCYFYRKILRVYGELHLFMQRILLTISFALIILTLSVVGLALVAQVVPLERSGKFVTLAHVIQIFVSTLVLLGAYQILFSLKRVEIQISDKYRTSTEIFAALRKQIIISRVLLGCLLIGYLSMFITLGFFLTDSWGRDQVVFTFMAFSFCIVFYLLNTWILIYFYRMGVNYLSIVNSITDSGSINRTKFYIILVIIIISLAFFRFMVYLEVWFMANWYRSEFTYRYTEIYRYPNVAMIYMNVICPFVIAIALCRIIIALGDKDLDGDDDDEESAELETPMVQEVTGNRVQQSTFGGESEDRDIDSIRGSIHDDEAFRLDGEKE